MRIDRAVCGNKESLAAENLTEKGKPKLVYLKTCPQDGHQVSRKEKEVLFPLPRYASVSPFS